MTLLSLAVAPVCDFVIAAFSVVDCAKAFEFRMVCGSFLVESDTWWVALKQQYGHLIILIIDGFENTKSNITWGIYKKEANEIPNQDDPNTGFLHFLYIKSKNYIIVS